MISLKNGVLLFLAALLLAACDEGKIYPEETPVDLGRTATVNVRFKGLGAWPKKNYLSLVALGGNSDTPTLNKRFSKPVNADKTITVTLNNLKDDTRKICIAIVSNGLDIIYTYYKYEVDKSGDNIVIDVDALELASYDRIQEQVFDANCIACHGGSTQVAGKLNLTRDKSYAALVDVEAPLSPDKKKYVDPGNPNNSYLPEILEENAYHKDMFNSTGKQEVLALIKTWIQEDAPDN